MLKLIVYPKGPDPKLINPSPFCAKSEVFLRMAHVEHKIEEFAGNPAKFAKKKLPVLEIKPGEYICDSYFIQKYLENQFSAKLDQHLSPDMHAEGFAFTKMLEEFFYWALLHERWFIDENWVKLRDSYFGHIPAILRKFLAGMIRKSSFKSAWGHGMSRHSDQDILSLGSECLKHLAHYLGQKPYILGDQVSSYDATSYAFIASVLHSHLGPELRKSAESYHYLRDYDQRMYQRVFEGQSATQEEPSRRQAKS
ncbi:glutathione S-transferase family protein [Pseudobacteriovorax antillogorgiicola]|uniref:Glutathione S-transferase n=1 Tax=Pseudobacteriovorax antillogorgiicola TaxID=1513793 RepID=A0A1Y6BHW4_9BACT|nr:glutathione S-transferase family protein [Pseudobacteriovorax antillogorgiicola]TCS55445.1 glutathione S-transferase [Pseudobacteriovorax antillogorgiicola]SMF12373.1 Glutathione S-transferase [Pseudobacteriovorax antillogorgiicola]